MKGPEKWSPQASKTHDIFMNILTSPAGRAWKSRSRVKMLVRSLPLKVRNPYSDTTKVNGLPSAAHILQRSW